MRKINNLDNALIYESSGNEKLKQHFYKRWISVAACIAILCVAVPAVSYLFLSSDKKNIPYEICLELNDKLYSVVTTKKSPAYDNYNLEQTITSDLIGEYLGEYTTTVDEDGNEDTFKMYRYINCPVTEYDWIPRIIAKSTEGNYYHALIGSVFDETIQTASEVLSVYGISSSESIVSIENQYGKKITDRAFIDAFYNGLFIKEYGGNDFMQENVYQNTGVEESDIDQLYSNYANDMVNLKVELTNGLVIQVDFTSHNFVGVEHGLFFKVGPDWLDLVSVFRK